MNTSELISEPIEMDEVYYFENMDQVDAIIAPYRYRMIIELTRRPVTGAELARILDISRPRAYYHLKILEKHSLIKLVEQRLVKGIVENRYLARAKYLSVQKLVQYSREHPEDSDYAKRLYKCINKTAFTLLEATYEDINEAGEAHEHYAISFEHTLDLTPEQISELEEDYAVLFNKIRKMGEENNNITDQKDMIRYRHLHVMLPLPQESNLLNTIPEN